MSTRMLVRIAEALERIQSELRRSNEDRDRFYREVLDVLTQAKDPEGSLRSEQPAAASQCGRRADLATADDGSSVWFTCVLDRGHADFHTDGHGVEWITTPAATSQREGEDG